MTVTANASEYHCNAGTNTPGSRKADRLITEENPERQDTWFWRNSSTNSAREKYRGASLSRSLFASMIPAAKSGEFFSLFGIMEKFATLLGPLLFAGAAAVFGSSRPAVLSLILFFIVGIALLLRVKVEEGRLAARTEDKSLKRSLD